MIFESLLILSLEFFDLHYLSQLIFTKNLDGSGGMLITRGDASRHLHLNLRIS